MIIRTRFGSVANWVACLLWAWCLASSHAFQSLNSVVEPSRINPRLLTTSTSLECPTLISQSEETAQQPHVRPHIVFTGGGLYFYWQAGVITYLREQGYDLSAVTVAGASAGALTATLTATNVCFYKATELALGICDDLGVWDRRGGLQGVWGGTIEDWLHELLPENAVELAQHQELAVLVTQLPSFQKERIQQFTNRDDLIRCNMASVHIPWFLDGKWTSSFRGKPYMDGSFLASSEWLQSNRPNAPTWVLDHTQDPVFKDTTLLDAVGLLAPEGIWNLLEQGKRYAATMEEQGRFQGIPQFQ